MKRVILDTNIYGLIVVDEDRGKIRNSVEKEKVVIVYGFPIIRKELRDTPKNIRIKGANLRNDLLIVYDGLVKNQELKLTGNTEKLADDYFNDYREVGGHASKSVIM